MAPRAPGRGSHFISLCLNVLAHDLQLGLDNRNKETEDIIEATQVVEEVDEEQQITEEVF